MNNNQVLTVGVPHPDVIANPNNSPNTIYHDPLTCFSVSPLGGLGTFVDYGMFGTPNHQIKFQPPSFTTPAQVCTMILKYYKCTSSCYTEDEPVYVTIINSPPTIEDPKNSDIFVEDGKSISEPYIPADIENSPLL